MLYIKSHFDMTAHQLFHFCSNDNKTTCFPECMGLYRRQNPSIRPFPNCTFVVACVELTDAAQDVVFQFPTSEHTVRQKC